MVRLLVTYETPADPAAFDRYYREVHSPLARTLPGLRRYTVSRAGAAIRGEKYYLVAELDWDDMASFRAAFASPEGRATVDDVANFAPAGTRSMVFEIEDH